MTGEPVCVVIVNYNAGEMLVRCVRSVLTSTVPVQVYVSDNGSTDGSLANLRSTLGDDPLVNIIENHANIGFAKANNVVLPFLRYDYLFCLNPDAVLAENCLENLVRVAVQCREFGCLAGHMIQTRVLQRVTGIDIAPVRVASAVAEAGLDFQLGDANSGNFGHRQYNAVIAKAALHHIERLETALQGV